MAIDYAALAASAGALVAANGRTVTLVRRNRSSADAAKPWRASATPDSTLSVSAVVVPYEAKDVDGEYVKAEDQRMIVVSSSDLSIYDEVDDGAETWRIVRVVRYNPGSVTVAYEMQLRR